MNPEESKGNKPPLTNFKKLLVPSPQAKEVPGAKPQTMSTPPNPLKPNAPPPLSSKAAPSAPVSAPTAPGKKFMDFEAFREQKQKKETPVPVGSSKQVSIPESDFMEVDEEEVRKKYQDHRLGPGIGAKPTSPSAGAGTRFQDQRLGQGINRKIPKQGGGKRYQDQRLGNALDAPLPENAGSGKKYQDHRLGPGKSKK